MMVQCNGAMGMFEDIMIVVRSQEDLHGASVQGVGSFFKFHINIMFALGGEADQRADKCEQSKAHIYLMVSFWLMLKNLHIQLDIPFFLPNSGPEH